MPRFRDKFRASVRARVVLRDIGSFKGKIDKIVREAERAAAPQALNELKIDLDNQLKATLGVAANGLALTAFGDSESLGGFGIPAENSITAPPEIGPANFNQILDHPSVSRVGDRVLRWFSKKAAYALTRYEWTGRTGAIREWLRILEEGLGPILGYAFVGQNSSPGGSSRSGFGHMIKADAATAMKQRAGRIVNNPWKVDGVRALSEIDKGADSIRLKLQRIFGRIFRQELKKRLK